MKNTQSITRVIGFIAVALVIIGQVFKSQTLVLQPYLPYLIILGIIMLAISFFLRVKTEGATPNLKARFVIMFLGIVVSVVIAIYFITTSL